MWRSWRKGCSKSLKKECGLLAPLSSITITLPCLSKVVLWLFRPVPAKEDPQGEEGKDEQEPARRGGGRGRGRGGRGGRGRGGRKPKPKAKPKVTKKRKADEMIQAEDDDEEDAGEEEDYEDKDGQDEEDDDVWDPLED